MKRDFVKAADESYKCRLNRKAKLAAVASRRAALAILLFLLAFKTMGCVPIFVFPPDLPLAELPPVEGPSATVMIARPDKFCGCWANHFISIDGTRIARLRPGQYTSFNISPGRHTLQTTWHVGEPMLLGFDFYPYEKALTSNFEPDRKYLFLLNHRCFARKETDRVDLLPVDGFPRQINLEPEHFVPPGPRRR